MSGRVFALAAGELWVSGSCKDVCGFIARFLQTSRLYFYYDCCCEDILKNIVFLFEITFHSVDLSLDISGSWGILAKHAE